MAVTKQQARGLARRQAILDAAAELFLEKGFERTSLSDILERSKGSRSTLYDQFGGKEGLLRAMIEAATTRVWQVLGLDGDPLALSEEGLVTLGVRFVGATLANDAVAIYRIIVAEGQRVPGLAQFFYDAGPRILKQHLTERFRAALGADAVCPHAAEDMAQAFIGSVLGDFYFRKAIGQASVWDDSEIERHVRGAVRIFLGGVAWANRC